MDTWNDPEVPELPEPSKNRYDRIYEMWEGGVRDIEEIALEVSYTPTYVRQLLRRRGHNIPRVDALAETDIKGVCDDYEAGVPISVIQRKWKISSPRVYAILDTMGIELRKNNPLRTQIIEQAVELYQAGNLVKDIYTQTGITPSELYRVMAERNIELRNNYIKPDPEVVKHAIELYQRKDKVEDIIADTGVSLGVLYRELTRQNIPIRRKTPSELFEKLEEAVFLYQRGSDIRTINETTGIGSLQLYRELRMRGIPHRVGKVAQGVDTDEVFRLYDAGESFAGIQRQTKVTLFEMVDLLKKRGQALRTGLAPRVTDRSMQIALQEYADGRPEDDIVIDTLVTQTQLLAEVRKSNKELRP